MESSRMVGRCQEDSLAKAERLVVPLLADVAI